MTVWSFSNTYVKDFGFLSSLIGSIIVLFISLAKIAKTIKSVQNAFPNENFVWINWWNLIIFTLLNLILFVMKMLQEVMTNSDDNVIDSDYEKTYWRMELSSLVFFVVQYTFALYMDLFLFYLVLKFT